jgi:hypothetical protein
MHRDGLAPGTIRAHMIPLKAMFNAAVRDKRIPESPVQEITLPRKSDGRVDRDRLPSVDVVNSIAAEMLDRYRADSTDHRNSGSG